MVSASTARSPWPRRSRACRRSRSELVKVLGVAARFGSALCSSLRWLTSRSDFVGRLERLIDGPFPRDLVHHVASTPRGRLRLLRSPGTGDPSGDVRTAAVG